MTEGAIKMKKAKFDVYYHDIIIQYIEKLIEDDIYYNLE